MLIVSLFAPLSLLCSSSHTTPHDSASFFSPREASIKIITSKDLDQTDLLRLLMHLRMHFRVLDVSTHARLDLHVDHGMHDYDVNL